MLNKLKKQSGASIVLAILLLLVITLACASLFAVISSTVRNVVQGRDREQALILAQTLSEQVKVEVQDANSKLGRYLDSNIGKNKPWGYYNPDETFKSNKYNATRTFSTDLSATGAADSLKATAQISMYWMSDYDTEFNEFFDGDKRSLFVTSTVIVDGKAGKQSASVLTVYDYQQKEDSNYWWSYRGGV